jgi:hypothetical protein
MENADGATVTIVGLKRSLLPTNWSKSVRVLGLSECKDAAVSLAHAFAADDFAQYLCDADESGSSEQKWQLHVDMMTYLVTAHCHSGIVTAMGPEYDSVALWYVWGTVPVSEPSECADTERR